MLFITRLLLLSYTIAFLLFLLVEPATSAPLPHQTFELNSFERNSGDIVHLERRLHIHINWHNVGDFFRHVGEKIIKGVSVALNFIPNPLGKIAGKLLEVGDEALKKKNEELDAKEKNQRH